MLSHGLGVIGLTQHQSNKKATFTIVEGWATPSPRAWFSPAKDCYHAQDNYNTLAFLIVITFNVISLMKSCPLDKILINSIVSYDHIVVKVNIFPHFLSNFLIKVQKMSYMAQYHNNVNRLYQKYTAGQKSTELLMEANNFSHVGKKIYSANVINWLLLSLWLCIQLFTSQLCTVEAASWDHFEAKWNWFQ